MNDVLSFSVRLVNYQLLTSGIGQVVLCKVVEVKVSNFRATMQLTIHPKEVMKQKATEDMSIQYETMLPGMLVDTVVMDVCFSSLISF